MPSLRNTLFSAACLLIGFSGCALYDPPPNPQIKGLTDGILPSSQPLEIVFSEPVDPNTLRVLVVPYVVDAEGYLGDEDSDPTTSLNPLFTHDPGAGDTGGTGMLNADGTGFLITPSTKLPLGEKLAVLVEKGLSDFNGHSTLERTRLPFSYELKCDSGTASNLISSGAYFFLFNIDKPLPVQIQIFADMEIDQDTGEVLAQFTGADRNPDPNRCPFPCESTEVCRLLPQPECVIPSEKAGTVDEHTDFIVNPDPPTGYSFTVKGCVQDNGNGGAVLITEPTDLIVEQPPVEVTDLTITCTFELDDDGIFRCAGSSGSKDVKIGGKSAGAAVGSSNGRPIPPGEEPADLPSPPGDD
ncbi:MAG: hypothetical protein IPK82_02900 [Polyangiaceae bacterium]|nr:hypothetical protein [Polyangiaceae bacterium]